MAEPEAPRTDPGAAAHALVKPRTAPPAANGGVLRIRESIPDSLAWTLGLVPVFLLLAAWYLVTAGAEIEGRIISPTILPSPGEVVRSFPELWFEPALTRNLFVSLGRVVQWFVLAVLVVFPLGMLMGSFTKIRAMFTPLSVFGAYLPIPALVPLTLSLFGTAVAWPNLLSGLSSIPSGSMTRSGTRSGLPMHWLPRTASWTS